MQLQDYINQWNGKEAKSRNGILGQCVSLSSLWAEDNGWHELDGPTAASIYRNFRHPDYQVIDNTPDGVPAPGDIIFWDETWGGGAGHTGVIVSADKNTFQVFEQNDGDNGLAHVAQHSYDHILGWFHPVANSATTVDTPGADNEGVVNGAGLQGHSEPNTSSSVPWKFDDNEHITLLSKVRGENVTTGPYAPSDWWYLAHGNDANAQAAGLPQVWVSDAFVRTTHNPANVPDYVAPAAPAATQPQPEFKPVIDVSHAQGDIDWAQVKNNVAGAIISAGHTGVSFGGVQPYNTDPKFIQNQQGARDNGIPVGFYWYGYPSLDPEAEASAFMNSVAHLVDGEILFLDIEEDGDNVKDWISKFTAKIEGVTGRKVQLYSNKNYIDKYGLSGVAWEANFNNNPGNGLHSDAVMHQYTDKGSIPGINGNVDCSKLLKGTLTEMDVRTDVPQTQSQPTETPAPAPQPAAVESATAPTPTPATAAVQEKSDKPSLWQRITNLFKKGDKVNPTQNAVHPKVQAAAVGGAITTVVLWAFSALGLHITTEMAGAITTLIATLTGYFVSNQ
jgi:GH25 family lysozyme M1 (1,4-beta-N-acetylmuramidase)